MKNFRIQVFFVTVVLFSVPENNYCQSTNGNPVNNNYNATHFVGFNNTNGANPLQFRTNALTRMRLNGTQTNNYNGFNHDVSGHFGIGLNNYFATETPLTMLHLEGENGTPFQFGQYRGWMRTGVFMREHSDGMYVGLKPEGFNRSDAIINWSDDAGGVDKLRFLFTTTQLSLPGPINPLRGDSDNGYEFMRMQSYTPTNNSQGFPIGHIGIGPLFTDVIIPRSRLHIHAEDNLPTFTQITTQNGTGYTLDDGMRLGVELLSGFTTGFLRWQENTPLIFQTDWDNTPGGTQNGERIRIHSTGAPNVPAATLMGTNVNVSRIAMSYIGSNPITQPRTLLHMGANNDGVPDFMEYGAMVANANQAAFLGVTPNFEG